jgi:pimeloyl-ACP methyl ester carboxylesterase
MKSTRSLVTAGLAGGAAALVWAAYRKEIKAARRRIETGRQFIDSPHGKIEFAESGDGPAVLLIHGAGGGFDQGLDLGRTFLGDHYRVIAPSRFGYLGTSLPADASAEAQADAHLRLLDALKLDRVPVIGVSAGAPSAMQFCLSHPERCSALVLVVPMAYAPDLVRTNNVSPAFEVVLNAIASSDFIFWLTTKTARTTLVETILGTPAGIYQNATDEGRRAVNDLLRSIQPISKRVEGIWNDSVVASTLTRYNLEEIRVPTLVISCGDDRYGTYESALYTAAQIPEARIIGFATGGHVLLGHEREVRSQITGFVNECLPGRAPSKTEEEFAGAS